MMSKKRSAEKTVRDIRRATRRKYSAEEKIRIVIEGLRGEDSIAELCRREGINANVYYRWSKEFMEAGKKRLAGDVVREATSLPIRQTLRQLDIGKSAFYSWLKRYSESTVYRILKAEDLITSPAYILMQAGDQFQNPSTRVNELWQTDFTYFKIIGWGWYYPSTILDDYSRYIIAWRLCSGMAATDVQDTLDDALAFTGLDQVEVNHKPRLLSDNGPCYVSGELSDYLEQQGMTHTRGAPYHPQTQGKIERWRRSMKNQILLNHYYLPSELQEHLQRFISYYNHERYPESLDNLTPADVFYGRDQDILEQRQQIKHNTMSMRRKMVYDNRNNLTNLMS